MGDSELQVVIQLRGGHGGCVGDILGYLVRKQLMTKEGAGLCFCPQLLHYLRCSSFVSA